MATAITSMGEIECIDPLQGLGRNPSASARWIFCPNKSQKKRQGQDYHTSFCEESYLPYFKNRLVPAAERAFPEKKLVFVFDNATYHVAASYKVGDEAVNRSKNMELLAAFVELHGNPPVPRLASGKVNSRLTSRAELMVQYDEVVARIGGDLEIYCRSKGHEILLTPARASHFQPIELYWAAVKNEIASRYRVDRNFATVHQQLLNALDKWGTQSFCSRLIDHCTRKIREFHDLILQADAVVEIESSSSSDDELSSVASDLFNEESSHSGENDI
jgi:hypothetical protein